MPLTLIAICLCAAALAAPAQGHDSEAPPGAPHSWLPEVPWVMQHWVPFDEVRLQEKLATDDLGIFRWLSNDHRTLAQLVRRRTGMSVEAMTDYLVEPWVGRVSAAQLDVLRDHTRLMLTQGHLAQHVLFHWFHGSGALERTRAIFGVPRARYQKLRNRGWTPLGIARTAGRTPTQVREAIERQLAAESAVGVRRLRQSPEQAAYMDSRRFALIGCFLHRPLPKLDPDNPFGDHWSGHPQHSRGERPGLRPGSKMETALRRRSSCWHEPALRTPRTPASARAAALCRTAGRAAPARRPSPAGARPGTRRS
jgi:hypothetical protein